MKRTLEILNFESKSDYGAPLPADSQNGLFHLSINEADRKL